MRLSPSFHFRPPIGRIEIQQLLFLMGIMEKKFANDNALPSLVSFADQQIEIIKYFRSRLQHNEEEINDLEKKKMILESQNVEIRKQIENLEKQTNQLSNGFKENKGGVYQSKIETGCETKYQNQTIGKSCEDKDLKHKIKTPSIESFQYKEEMTNVDNKIDELSRIIKDSEIFNKKEIEHLKNEHVKE